MSFIYLDNKINLKKIFLYGGDDNESITILLPVLVIVIVCILISIFYFIFSSKSIYNIITSSQPNIIVSSQPIINNDVINYNLIDNGVNNITYNNGENIGFNSALVSKSTEWDNTKGIFTASSDGFYLINASFFINGKTAGARIALIVNNKLRYIIIESNAITAETLRTYSKVEQLNKGDILSFKVTSGNGFTVFFGSDIGSHSNITITKLNINNYYSLNDNGVNNITYNNGENIGFNSALVSKSSEWDNTKGIFTASSDGVYLINASFFINGKTAGTRIALIVNNKLRYVVIEANAITTETLRTYSKVEQLNKGDILSFKVTSGNGFTVFFGSDIGSHSNITITKLNINNYYSLNDNGVNNITYNNGENIGFNSALVSKSSEWDNAKGIFTASSDGVYLINASFFINGKTAGTRIALMVNNKLRYVIIEANAITAETLRTYSKVEQLSKGDTLTFKVTSGNGFTVFFGSDIGSHSNITFTRLI